MRPRIAITVAARQLADADARRKYRDAVSGAGGEPVLFGDVEAGQVPAALEAFDGLLLAGGLDVDPTAYGSRPHPLVEQADAELDALELAAAKFASRSGLPTLAICRGMQVANVALGGSLYEDIDDQYEPRNGLRLRHKQTPDHARHETTHTVDLKRGSRLAAISGASAIATNTLHHQAVRRVAHGLEPVAWARDGIVEGLESAGEHPFFIAVQWHPEELVGADEPSRSLFRSFVDAATRSASGRRAAAGER